MHSAASTVPGIEDVYARFSDLREVATRLFEGELGGKLVLYGAMDAEGVAIALSGNIAGAATLGIDGDHERLKLGVRHGFCNFMVNNLDEALRILKNEVRKKEPVSVCLGGDFRALLREIVERGVQPDILSFADGAYDFSILTARGAVALGGSDLENADGAWISWSALSAAALWLPKVDALAAKAIPDGDARVRWLQLAPRYLGRPMAGQRGVRMTADEAERFQALVAKAVGSGDIGAEIKIVR